MPFMRSQINGAIQAYRSGGLFIVIRRICAYFWKEFAWFFIRLINQNTLITRNIYGNTMYLSLKDAGISKELAVFKTHEPITTEILRQEIKKGMYIVDIGANIGYYALQEAKIVGNDGLVIAIEPVPKNLKLLKRNIEINEYANIRVYDIAIGAENGTTKMYSSDSSNLYSLQPNTNANGAYFTVNMLTLDNLLKNEPCLDYLQMDMEGYEVEAIKGMFQILNRYNPEIFLELHPKEAGTEKAVNLLKTFKELGYKSKFVVDKTFNYPWVNNSSCAIETLSIDDLIIDERITKGRSVLNIFLEPTKNIKVCKFG